MRGRSFRLCVAAALGLAVATPPGAVASAPGTVAASAPTYRPALPKLRRPYHRPSHAPLTNPNGHPDFFDGEEALGNGVYYLTFPNGNYFGYYSYLSDSHYIYHFDLGYEYVFDAQDADNGVYLYDFTSNDYFYTSPSFPFPYLYDFNLKTVLYYYPDPSNPGHYNTNGVRYFYDFATGQIITK